MISYQLMLPANRAFNSDGAPEPGATLSLFVTGTSTPALFYEDAGLTVSLGSVITANSAGEFSPIPYQQSSVPFRLILKDAEGTVLDDLDPFYFGQNIYNVTGAITAATRAILAALTGTSGSAVILTEAGREGLFEWNSTNLSAKVTSDPQQGVYVAGTGDPTGASGAWVRVNSTPLRPEWFGAQAENSAFDNGPALNAMTNYVNALGGGRMQMSNGATYWIGAQTSTLVGVYQFPPVTQYIMYIHNCTKFVELDLNGAVLKCRAGLKYGNFNADGTVNNPSMPYYGNGIAVPYYSVVRVEGNSGGVVVKNGELNGNISNLTIGGTWGDVGRQIPQSGVEVVTNTNYVVVENIHSHDHGLDGGTTIWPGVTAATAETNHYPVILRNCRFLYNGRQGWSHVGGSGFYVYNCDFSNTGKGLPFYSAPGAGLDMEAESSIIRKVRYYNCRFENNTGVALLTVGDVENVEAYASTFIGTTNWSLWPQGYRHRFHDCLFVGAMTNAQGSSDPEKASQFHNCRFLHGSTRSPTGVVYNSAGAAFSPMCDFGGVDDTNVLFNNCGFDTETNSWITLPYTSNSIYRNCNFVGTNAGTSFCRGSYEGRNKATTTGGHIIDDGSGTKNYGEFLNNGVVTANSTYIRGCVQLAAQPLASVGATLDVGPITDPGYTHNSIIRINEWEDPVGTARQAKLEFWRNGALFAGIFAYYNTGSMIFNPPTNSGGGHFWFQDPTNAFTNLLIASNGVVTSRSSMNAGGSGFVTSNSAWAGAIGSRYAQFFSDATNGATIYGYGTSYDVAVINRVGNQALRVPANTINVEFPGNITVTGTITGGMYSVQNKTAGYTATETTGDIVVKCDLVAGFTVVLPTAVGNKTRFTFKKIQAAGAIVIDGNASETIDGGLTATLNNQNESITIVSDNANWIII